MTDLHSSVYCIGLLVSSYNEKYIIMNSNNINVNNIDTILLSCFNYNNLNLQNYNCLQIVVCGKRSFDFTYATRTRPTGMSDSFIYSS